MTMFQLTRRQLQHHFPRLSALPWLLLLTLAPLAYHIYVISEPAFNWLHRTPGAWAIAGALELCICERWNFLLLVHFRTYIPALYAQPLSQLRVSYNDHSSQPVVRGRCYSVGCASIGNLFHPPAALANVLFSVLRRAEDACGANIELGVKADNLSRSFREFHRLRLLDSGCNGNGCQVVFVGL
jgi:hypothetical protein